MFSKGLKKRALIRGFGCLFLLIFFSAMSHAAVPQKINYQGYLTNAAGTPYHGAIEIRFSIYDVPSGGTALWSETQVVTVDHGVYGVNLGETTPLSLTFDAQYYLGVRVSTEPEMTPRRALASVPYALRAGSVDAAAGTISGVTAGAGLAGGGTTGSIALDVGAGTGILVGSDAVSVDTAVIQRRVSALCPAGQSIRAINLDGTVVCQIDANSGGTITGVTAGSGLTGGGNTGNITLDVGTGVGLTAGADSISVNFAGSGSAATAARSDHAHAGLYVDLSTNQTIDGVKSFSSNLLAQSNVGIGTATPTQRLEISGNVKISGSGNGLGFPDGTTQTTAVTGGGGGVPSGFMILGETSTAPGGYSSTGKTLGFPGTWAAKTAMPTARYNGAVAVVNNRIYLFGGISGANILATTENMTRQRIPGLPGPPCPLPDTGSRPGL